MNKRILYAGIISLALAMIFSACPLPDPNSLSNPDPNSGLTPDPNPGFTPDPNPGFTPNPNPNPITIENWVYSGRSDLTEIIIPDNVTSIGAFAFSGCSELTEIIIPASVTSIGDSAFQNCWRLTSIQAHGDNTVYKSIGGVLFNKAGTELVAYPNGKGATYTIPNTVTSIGNSAFYGCSGLTEITIPDSVTYIGSYAFIGCGGLTEITIPDSVIYIGDSAFRGTSLTEIIIPASVTSIGVDAFQGCGNLTLVYVERDTDPLTTLGNDAFDSTHGSLEIHVPATREEDYKGMDGWIKYAATKIKPQQPEPGE